MPALIFDCDGVLADTEQHGHLPAFNSVFEQYELPVLWDVATYAQKVKIGGGKERLASILTDEFVANTGLPTDAQVQREMVMKWHHSKTAVYTALVESGALPARPGIARIVAEAHAAGWKLAVASTSAEASVTAVLRHAVGDVLASEFQIFAGDMAPRKKPAPDIYDLALAGLDLGSEECVVIEDSEIGLRAATSAGLRTIITVSGFTENEDFSGASLVVTSLGDPDGEKAAVLKNPLKLPSLNFIDLNLIEAILTTERPHRVAAVATPELEKTS